MPAEKKGSRKFSSASTSLDAPLTVEVPAGVFKNTCLALMDKVRDEGMHVVITKHGDAVARLVPAGIESLGARAFMRPSTKFKSVARSDTEKMTNSKSRFVCISQIRN